MLMPHHPDIRGFGGTGRGRDGSEVPSHAKARPAGRMVEAPPYALPCPVWVYGNPCEIDFGLGHFRSCD